MRVKLRATWDPNLLIYAELEPTPEQIETIMKRVIEFDPGDRLFSLEAVVAALSGKAKGSSLAVLQKLFTPQEDENKEPERVFPDGDGL